MNIFTIIAQFNVWKPKFGQNSKFEVFVTNRNLIFSSQIEIWTFRHKSKFFVKSWMTKFLTRIKILTRSSNFVLLTNLVTIRTPTIFVKWDIKTCWIFEKIKLFTIILGYDDTVSTYSDIRPLCITRPKESRRASIKEVLSNTMFSGKWFQKRDIFWRDFWEILRVYLSKFANWW